VAEGDTVLAGDPVMRLSAEDAPLVVEASLPPEALLLLQEAGGAALGLPGGARVPATLDGPLPTGATDEALPVTLHPAEPLPPELSGRLARIRIERDPQAALGPVAGLWERGDAALGTAAATAESGAERAGAWWSDTVRPRLSSAFAPKETRQ